MSGQKYPYHEDVYRVVIENREGRTWVLKKKTTILEWCEGYQDSLAPAKPKPRKVAKPPPKPILKKKKPRRPPTPSSSEENSEDEDEDEDEDDGSSSLEVPSHPGGYTKMNLNYKVTKDGADVGKLAKKMAKNAKFADH